MRFGFERLGNAGELNDCADKPSMLNFSAETDVLARVAELAAQRHQVLAHNLANVNTQGYQRLDTELCG